MADGSTIPSGSFDFKGTLREVIVQICNATCQAIWWDMEKDTVHIQPLSSVSEGLAKLGAMRTSCEVISSGQTMDFTNQLGAKLTWNFRAACPWTNAATAKITKVVAK